MYVQRNHDTDKLTNTTIDFSSITQLTNIDTNLPLYDSDNENDGINTIIIHPSTTNITCKSDVSCATPSRSNCSTSSHSSSSSTSESEGHTHSLSPSTNNDHPCGHPLYVSMSTNKVFENNQNHHELQQSNHRKLKDIDSVSNDSYDFDNNEEKQHILKPITIPSKSVSDFGKSKPVLYANSKHSNNNSNQYKHLEQQMIHSMQMMDSSDTENDNDYKIEQIQVNHLRKRTSKPMAIQKSKSNPHSHNNNKHVPMHPGNIVTTRYPSPPIHPLHCVQSQPSSRYSQPNTPCILSQPYYTQMPQYPYIDTNIQHIYYCNGTPSPITPNTPTQQPQMMYRPRFSTPPQPKPPPKHKLVLQQYHSNPVQYELFIKQQNMNQSKSNLSFFAYNHDNGSIQKLTPVSIDESKTPISSYSYSQTTPNYTNNTTTTVTTTPSKSIVTDQSITNTAHLPSVTNIQKNNYECGKYWDFAQCNGHQCLLTDFAISKFQIHKHRKTSIFSNNSHKNNNKQMDLKFLNELFSFAPFKKMKHSLLTMENREMNKIGMQIWKNINSYMGLRKSSKSDHKHIEKIINIALSSNSVIKDEIFCQIVKQTNCNKQILNDKTIDFYNLVKGWKLMCICCSIFCPSNEFAKYLACYLFNKAKDIKFGDGKISEMAVFALNALDDSMITGNRNIEPIPYEITYLENYQSIPIKVYFLDDTFITILINSQTTTKQLCITISSQLKLKHLNYFGLYEFEEISTKKDIEYELKQYNSRLDMSYDQKVEHLDNLLIDRELDSNTRVMDVFSSWMRCTNKKHKNIRFVYKCKILDTYKLNQDAFNINEWKLIYLNEYYNVMHNKYPMISENDLLHLCAIQIQSEYGNNCNLSKIDIDKYISKHLITKYGNKKCKELLLEKQCTFYKDFTQKQCWISYIKYLNQLHDINFFVGGVFFRCVGKINNKNKLLINNDLIIGINEHSLLLINPPTKQIILKFKLEQIITYGFKSKEFIFVAGTLAKQEKYQFATIHSKQINKALQQYIDIRSSSNSH